MVLVDTQKIAEILAECAEKYILPRYKLLENHEISSKTGPRDLVTHADLDVEAHLNRVLPDLLPGSVVIGEEGVSSGQQSLDILKDKTAKVWIVDPVDGTYNFVHHQREFGIMLACIIDGRTQYGWIYDVLGNVHIIAERGAGAFSNGNRLRVKPLTKRSELTGHINPGYFPRQYKAHIKEARDSFASCHTLNCAAHEYLRIATGEAQFSLYSKLKPWDHLPGVLIVQEAGGYAALWDGTPYTPQDNHVGLIVAASRENWQIAHDAFLKKYI